MFDDTSGRLATNLEQAQEYLWKFMRECCNVTDKKVIEHNRDFDLYLPFLMQIFERHGEQPGERLSMMELEVLYMDAAWELATQAFLRPGPRVVEGDQPRDGYGNGYSLTAKGRKKLGEGPSVLLP